MSILLVPPVAHREKISSNHYECELHLDTKSPWFVGHFPGKPILPGFVQIGWVVAYGAKLGLDPGCFVGIPRAKFQAVIAPDTTLRLCLQRKQQSLEFRFESQGIMHSSGTIKYGG